MNIQDYTQQITQITLARAIGVAPSFVNQWVKKTRKIPPVYCVAIERLSQGQVSRQELRPDDFWKIWPDLAYYMPTLQAK